MKQVDKEEDCESEKGNRQGSGSRPLDADLIRFVEALAIADAKRDHLAAANATSIKDGAAGNLSSQAEASTNDSRSHLRPILGEKSSKPRRNGVAGRQPHSYAARKQGDQRRRRRFALVSAAIIADALDGSTAPATRIRAPASIPGEAGGFRM